MVEVVTLLPHQSRAVSSHDSTTPDPGPSTPQRSRTQQTELLHLFLEEHDDTSQRRFATEHDLPRTTLQHWLARHQHASLDPDCARFFDSPAGLVFLHGLLVALHLVFVLQGNVGLRLLTLFLRLTHLDHFVAASYGSRQQFAVLMEQAVLDFVAAVQPQLAQAMTPRSITIAEDETFHPLICLVAIEPVSNFLLVEEYSERRDAAAWDDAVARALAGLPVTVVCALGDEAQGLLAHAAHGLGVPHSPDLFHVQQEAARAMSRPLAAQTREAQRVVQEMQQKAAQARTDQEQAATQARGPGRPIDHAQRVQHAEAMVRSTARWVEGCVERQEQSRAAIRGLGEDDHPFDLSTGQTREAEEVRTCLEGRLATLETLARARELPASSAQRLAKARRVLPGLVAAVAFFLVRVRAAVAECYGEQAWGWAERLIAGMYVRQVAGKTRDAARRTELRAVAENCLAEARHVGAPPGGWEEAERRAREWAGWFQRSSSCVEGRNGQLALRQHSLHRLSTRKLRVLTALHNYWVKRSDGTTAAERFFGKKPEDLFTWLLKRLPLPARPARQRNHAA
jgi:Family of unknown function (DUF6399)